MKIYLDNCCLNRPFDDQTNSRIRLETEAIKIVLSLCEQKLTDWQLIISDISLYEIGNTPETSKRKALEWLTTIATHCINLTDKIVTRAHEFEESGLQAFDALHLACAEQNADILLTVDDKFLKKSQSLQKLKIEAVNPLKWIDEVL